MGSCEGSVDDTKVSTGQEGDRRSETCEGLGHEGHTE